MCMPSAVTPSVASVCASLGGLASTVIKNVLRGDMDTSV